MNEMMEMADLLTLVFEIMGTVAFAVSGAMIGIEKRMDILGICVLGVVTAVGGGVIRDLVLGNTPPQSFRDPIYINIAIITSVICFLPQVRQMFALHPHMYNLGLLWMDTIGLGVFTVVGISVAYSTLNNPGAFLATFVGVVTGVGGGVIRDVLAGDMPFILVRQFYASASIIGAVACAFLWNVMGPLYAMYIGALAVIILRILAAHYRWSLPRPKEIIEDVD